MSESYLSGAQTNHQVGYEGVLCFPRAVAHHHTPAVLLGQLTPESSGEHRWSACSHMHPTCACMYIVY